jgi:acyl-CoA thioesterase I
MSSRLKLVAVLAVSLVLCGQALARPSDSSLGSAGLKAARQRPGRPPTPPPPPPPPVQTTPTVLGHAPVGGDVSLNATIGVRFSEAMNTSSAESAFSISPAVSGSFSWSGYTLQYTPDSPLAADSSYTVTVAATAQSAAGISLASPVSWTFTTLTPVVQLGRISCVGDSITEGKYPGALQSLLGSAFEVGNFGSGGTCVVINNGGVAVPYIKTAVCRQAQQFLPSTVVIMLGTNDSDPLIYRRISRFVSDYEQLVRQFQAVPTNPNIYLVKPPAIFGDPYGLSNSNLVNGVIPRIEQVANEMGVSTIDVYSATAGHPEYFSDGVHPNSTGAAVIAGVIAQAIK